MSHSMLTTISGTSGEIDWPTLVSDCEPRIAAWCRRFGLQDADTADVSQNVLLKSVISIRSGNFDANKGHFMCWLKVVTDNTIRTLLWKRAARRECVNGERMDTTLQSICLASTDEPSSEEACIEEESLRHQLQHAENCVKPRVKRETWEAYRLTMHENFSPSHTAEQIGISVRDVYVAKCRVIGYLKRELGF